MINPRRFSENIPSAQALAPASITVATTTKYYDGGQAQRHVFVVSIGTNAATTFTAQLVQATDSTGTGVKNISTAIVSGGLANNTEAAGVANSQLIFEVLADHLDSENGFTYAALKLTPVGGGVVAGVTYHPFQLYEYPAGLNPATTYAENIEIVYQDNF